MRSSSTPIHLAQAMLGHGDLSSGALAGLLATVPMTLVMELLHRQLPRHERHSLPPRTVTMQVARATGQYQQLDKAQRLGLTLASHFAYGAITGSAYAPLARWLRLPLVPGGLGFGLLVWLISYLGWLPAVGLFPPPHREAPRRITLMIAAHVVWGLALGALLQTRSNDNSTKSFRRDEPPADQSP